MDDEQRKVLNTRVDLLEQRASHAVDDLNLEDPLAFRKFTERLYDFSYVPKFIWDNLPDDELMGEEAQMVMERMKACFLMISTEITVFQMRWSEMQEENNKD